MKHTIKNLTNGPQSLRGVDGPLVIGPLETLTDEFDPLWLASAKQVRYLEVTEKDPLDHDGDGIRGGAVAPVNNDPEPESDAPDEPAKRRGRPPKNKD